jgi:hypothetical protein
MDKLIHDQGKVTISNDGATIIKLLDIVHPAAKTLVDIAKSQDDEVRNRRVPTPRTHTHTTLHAVRIRMQLNSRGMWVSLRSYCLFL